MQREQPFQIGCYPLGCLTRFVNEPAPGARRGGAGRACAHVSETKNDHPIARGAGVEAYAARHGLHDRFSCGSICRTRDTARIPRAADRAADGWSAGRSQAEPARASRRPMSRESLQSQTTDAGARVSKLALGAVLGRRHAINNAMRALLAEPITRRRLQIMRGGRRGLRMMADAGSVPPAMRALLPDRSGRAPQRASASSDAVT